MQESIVTQLSQLFKTRRNAKITIIASIFIVGLVGVTVALTYNALQPQSLPNGADANIFLDLQINGNDIKGSGSNIVADIDLSNLIEVDSLRGGVIVPVDPNTGQPTGQARYQPIVITKDIDVSSPLISQGLVTSPVVVAEFHYLRHQLTGEIVNYYNIKIEQARITSIREYSLRMDDGTVRHMEEVSFIFQKITWTYLGPDGNVAFQDTVGGGA